MANILVLDDDPVAQKAFLAILGNQLHKVWFFSSDEKAWSFLSRYGNIDLIVSETKLEIGLRLSLLRKVRSHYFFKGIPVVMYSKLRDKDIVQSSLRLGVQQYLVKPYEAEKLFKEIDKAVSINWREQHIEKPEAVCSRLGVSRKEYVQMLESLEKKATQGVQKINATPQDQFVSECGSVLTEIQDLSEKMGFLGLNRIISDVDDAARSNNWERLPKLVSDLDALPGLILSRTRPGDLPASGQRVHLQDIEISRPISDDFWKTPGFEKACPLKKRDTVLYDVSKLAGFPVIERVASAFQLAVKEEPINIPRVLEITQEDPGLTTQILHYANSDTRAKDAVFDDPLVAIQSLGEDRLRTFASELITYPESLTQSKHFSWQHFCVRQVGRARLAETLAHRLNMQQEASHAYWAGLMYGMGSLLLMYLYPHHYKNVLGYMHKTQLSLLEVEALIFGATHEHVGAHFAKTHGIHPAFQVAIEFVSNPEEAPEEYQDTVALVSLADFLCQSYGLGIWGTRIADGYCNFRGHFAWDILEKQLMPAFNFVELDRNIKKTLVQAKYDLLV